MPRSCDLRQPLHRQGPREPTHLCRHRAVSSAPSTRPLAGTYRRRLGPEYTVHRRGLPHQKRPFGPRLIRTPLQSRDTPTARSARRRSRVAQASLQLDLDVTTADCLRQCRSRYDFPVASMSRSPSNDQNKNLAICEAPLSHSTGPSHCIRFGTAEPLTATSKRNIIIKRFDGPSGGWDMLGPHR